MDWLIFGFIEGQFVFGIVDVFHIDMPGEFLLILAGAIGVGALVEHFWSERTGTKAFFAAGFVFLFVLLRENVFVSVGVVTVGWLALEERFSAWWGVAVVVAAMVIYLAADVEQETLADGVISGAIVLGVLWAGLGGVGAGVRALRGEPKRSEKQAQAKLKRMREEEIERLQHEGEAAALRKEITELERPPPGDPMDEFNK